MVNFFRGAAIFAFATSLALAATPPEELVKRLSDDSFRVREDASKELWELGESALPLLEKTAAGSDPEAAHRAHKLIDQIRLGVLPDTPPDVAELVRKYLAAEGNNRMAPLYGLKEKRAWRQILRLYAGEKAKGGGDPASNDQLKQAVQGVAELAARECILSGEIHKAVEYLLMAPDEGRARENALAALARADSSAAKWIEEAMRKDEPAAQQRWHLAKHLAAGNLGAAEELAVSLKDQKTVALIHLSKGNPVPFLEGRWDSEGLSEVHNLYRGAVKEIWQKGKVSDATVRRLADSVKPANEEVDNGLYVASSLLLLGKEKEGEAILLKLNPVIAFTYYDALDRVDDALKVIGLDPKNPDYAKFGSEKLKRFLENQEEHSLDKDMLLAVVGFMDRRGMDKEAKAILTPLLKAQRDKDQEAFVETLTELFNRNGEGIEHLVIEEAIDYAGKDPLRWSEIYQAAFSERDAPNTWLQWLEKQGVQEPAERLKIVAGIFGLWRGEEKRRDVWIERAWQVADKAEPVERMAILRMLATYSSECGDAVTGIRAMKELIAAKPGDEWLGNYVIDLSAMGQFAEAGEIWKKWMEERPDRPEFRACLSACLRLGGKNAEADEQDRLIEKLYLGEASAGSRIGMAYATFGDYGRARMWWKKVVIEGSPEDRSWAEAAVTLARDSLIAGDWAIAASLGEVVAWTEMLGGSVYYPQAMKLRYRLNVDVARAFDLLRRDRKQGLEQLSRCARNTSMEAFLPEDFFPALGREGLIEQQKTWAEESWQRQMAVIARFPAADNPKNTAAWLGARAGIHLQESEALVKEALTMRPDHPAYLDTLAEIWFARGDRAKALEYSRKAISREPKDSDLRRQFEHFRQDPLPK